MQLTPEEMKKKVEREGIARRNQAHENKAFIYFNSNKERLDALKSWYPLAYQKLKKDYPCFCESPDDYPPIVISSVNRKLQQLVPIGSYRELEFSSIRSGHFALA